MNNLYCNNCGQIFAEHELVTITERVPYGDTYADMPIGLACPYCKCDDCYDEEDCDGEE